MRQRTPRLGAQEERRAPSVWGGSFVAPSPSWPPGARSAPHSLRQSHHPPNRPRACPARASASVEAQAAAPRGLAPPPPFAAAPARAGDPQSAPAKIAEENHAHGWVLRRIGAGSTVEARGEKTRARTTGAEQVEKARGVVLRFESPERAPAQEGEKRTSCC